MMDSITVGAKIKMTDTVTSDYPVGSTATIIYIDEMDNVFIEWTDGKLSKLPIDLFPAVWYNYPKS